MELKQNMNEIFSDGIANIIWTHGLVLIDFYHIIPWKNEPVQRVPFLRLTITPEGFFDMVRLSGEIKDKMLQAGIVKRVGKDAAPAEKPAPAPAKKDAGKKPEKKSVPAPAKKAEAPAKKPAPAPAKKPVPAPAKPVAKAPVKSEAKPAAKAPAKPAAKPAPAPAKKAAPAPAKKAAPAAKAPAKGKKAK